MGIIEGKIFKNGNSAAVRLPKELGFEAGTLVTIEKIGRTLTITPTVDPAVEKRALLQLVADIEEIWRNAPYHEVEKREPIEFPDRPGLYR